MKRRRVFAGAALAVLTFAGAATAQSVEAPPSPPGDGLTEAVVADAPAPIESPPPPPSGTLADAIAAGHLLLEVRARYEAVDQARTAVLTDTGEAATLRTRLGWETGDWKGLKALVEFEDVRQIGAERFAVNPPGAATPPLNGADKSRFPLINDPDVTELNRAQIAWTPSAAFSAVVGRQRILIDDQRFIGNVGWRQDEQTFDAARLDAAGGRLKATYVYVSHVNRILGELRDWDSDSHLLNATWSPAEALRLQGFVYALDFGNSTANSSLTEGVKASGKTWLGLAQVAYNATWATQGEYRNNTAPYDLDYWGVDVAATFDIYTAKLSYESLEGNGARSFTTPLATNHAFQGWADAFVLPLGANQGFVDGLDDLNWTLNVKPRSRLTYLFNLDLIIRYHDFDAQRTGADLGHEWDAQLAAAVTAKTSLSLKYAAFQRETITPPGAAPAPASRTKVWFTFEYRF